MNGSELCEIVIETCEEVLQACSCHVVTRTYLAWNCRLITAQVRSTSERTHLIAQFLRFSLIDNGWISTARCMVLSVDAIGLTPKTQCHSTPSPLAVRDRLDHQGLIDAIVVTCARTSWCSLSMIMWSIYPKLEFTPYLPRYHPMIVGYGPDHLVVSLPGRDRDLKWRMLHHGWHHVLSEVQVYRSNAVVRSRSHPVPQPQSDDS